MTVRVTALLCPKCGGYLRGLRYDVAFCCPVCDIAVLFSEGRAQVHALHWATPKIEHPPRLYLPVWRVWASYEVLEGSAQQRHTANRVLAQPRLTVTAFQASRGTAFGDFGQTLTQQTAQLVPASPVPLGLPFGGVIRTPAEALRQAELLALLVIDQRCDVTGLSLRFNEPQLELWALPFAQMGDRLIDLVLGTELPTFAVDDLEELLA